MRLKQSLRRIDPGLLVVLTISVIAIWPFISRSGLPQETDAELHVFRLHELSYLVRGGELYPRWAPNFYHGYGYPIFNYYAPLTYYLGLGVELWPWFDAVDGVKAVFVLGLLLAGLGMYCFVKESWGRRAGYVAAALYLYSPYIQYIDPHARGVLPESFSFGLFPLALWTMDRVRKRGDVGSWTAAVLVVAAVILSHNLMGLLFFALLTGWSLWVNLFPDRADQESGKSKRSEQARLMLLALVTALGIATFFWLPVIWERNAVNLNTLIGEGDNYDFHTHFLSIKELLSFPNRLDWAATEPAFHFSLGVPQWVLGGLGILLLLRGTRRRRQLVFFSLALLALVLGMLPISAAVWETVPFLPYFQFPWRFLGAAAAMLSVLAGAGFETLEHRLAHSPVAWIRTSSSWLAPFFVALPILFGLPLSEPPPWPDFGEVSTLRMSLIEQKGRWLGTTSTADYVPASVVVIPKRNQAILDSLYEGEPPDRVNRAGKMIPEGAYVTTENMRPLKTRYHVSTPVAFPLRLFLFDFPGWTVRIDGEVVQTELGLPEGFIVVPVPAGRHEIEVAFESTPARQLAGWISGISLAFAAIIAWRLAASNRRKGPGDAQTDGQFALPLGVADRRLLIVVLIFTVLDVLLLRPLGWLHLQSSTFSAAPAEVQLFADFGEQVALLGFDASSRQIQPGDSLEITLYWQAQDQLEINYQVFLHVLGPDGVPVTQSDKLNPGEFPTRRWPLDKYVRDEHRVDLPADLPPGEYLVSTGLWVREEGWRLPLLDASGAQIGDSFTLMTLTVTD